MGYTTDFYGEFLLDKNLTDKQTKTINDISQERHDSDFSYYDKRRPYPSIWCQWIIEQTRDGNDILVWDEGEKFYMYTEWLVYLIENYFNKWNIKLNGEMEWQGEEREDVGKIVIEDNKIKIYDCTYDWKERNHLNQTI